MAGPIESAASAAFIATNTATISELTAKIAEVQATIASMKADNTKILADMETRLDDESSPNYGEFDQKYIYELFKKVFDTNSQTLQAYDSILDLYTKLMTAFSNDATLSQNSLAGGFY